MNYKNTSALNVDALTTCARVEIKFKKNERIFDYGNKLEDLNSQRQSVKKKLLFFVLSIWI